MNLQLKLDGEELNLAEPVSVRELLRKSGRTEVMGENKDDVGETIESPLVHEQLQTADGNQGTVGDGLDEQHSMERPPLAGGDDKNEDPVVEDTNSENEEEGAKPHVTGNEKGTWRSEDEDGNVEEEPLEEKETKDDSQESEDQNESAEQEPLGEEEAKDESQESEDQNESAEQEPLGEEEAKDEPPQSEGEDGDRAEQPLENQNKQGDLPLSEDEPKNKDSNEVKSEETESDESSQGSKPDYDGTQVPPPEAIESNHSSSFHNDAIPQATQEQDPEPNPQTSETPETLPSQEQPKPQQTQSPHFAQQEPQPPNTEVQSDPSPPSMEPQNMSRSVLNQKQPPTFSRIDPTFIKGCCYRPTLNQGPDLFHLQNYLAQPLAPNTTKCKFEGVISLEEYKPPAIPRETFKFFPKMKDECAKEKLIPDSPPHGRNWPVLVRGIFTDHRMMLIDVLISKKGSHWKEVRSLKKAVGDNLPSVFANIRTSPKIGEITCLCEDADKRKYLVPGERVVLDCEL